MTKGIAYMQCLFCFAKTGNKHKQETEKRKGLERRMTEQELMANRTDSGSGQRSITDELSVIKAQICDELCKWPEKEGITEQTIEEKCMHCVLGRI